MKTTANPVAAIPDLSLEEALAIVEAKFDAEAILNRPLGVEGIAEYYRQSDRGYRLFHSREGALHIALGGDGHRNTACYARQAEIFCEHLDAADAERAIELGCGMGYNTRWLAQRCPQRQFVGVDLTEAHIRHAKKQAAGLTNARFIVGNYEQLDCPNNAYDGALAVETLCQTPNLTAALAEAHRVLRPGARLVVIDCYRAAPIETYDPRLRRAMGLVERATAVDRFGVVEEWIEVAAAAGLRLVECRDLSHETAANLRRLYSLSRRFFRMPAAVRAMTRAFPPLMLENSICGLLMPFTVGAGAHTYRAIVVEKPET